MATSDHADRPGAEGEQRDSTSGCPECGGTIQSTTEETVCTNCGLVLDEHRIDNGPEWRSFDDSETNPERTGAPLTPSRHDRGLSTVIGRGTDANGNALSGRKRRQVGRMRREQSRGRWRSKAEQNLAHGLAETQRVASVLDLPESIRDQACHLFRSAAGEDLLPGRSIEAVAAASVFGACRTNGLPRTMEEIVDVSAVGRSGVDNAYRVLNQELGIPTVPPSPTDFIPRIASELHISDGTRRLAENLAQRAVEEGIGNGCNPAGLAAGCVYAAAQSGFDRVTQAELAECADVTPVTVRSRWEELRPLLEEDR
ncbi:MAG: transcription initiation factor TFIIB [Natrialbaceae archaeon]|jgi:transcription initiation factor TFIIB